LLFKQHCNHIVIGNIKIVSSGNESQIATYTNIVAKAVSQYLVIGTFSANGPEKCSGLPVRQYAETGLRARFQNSFTKIHCHTEDHTTPFDTTQNFLFCSFKRLPAH
jgi:hypothetical protein